MALERQESDEALKVRSVRTHVATQMETVQLSHIQQPTSSDEVLQFIQIGK